MVGEQKRWIEAYGNMIVIMDRVEKWHWKWLDPVKRWYW